MVLQKRCWLLLLPLLLLLLLLLFSAPARAEVYDDYRVLALYSDGSSLDDAPFSDAQQICAGLQQLSGITAEQCALYGIPYYSETVKEDLEAAVGAYFADSTATTLNILYYSGHGSYHKDRGSFLAISAKPLYDDQWSADELFSLLSGLPGDYLLLLDCCNSGGVAEPFRSETRSRSQEPADQAALLDGFLSAAAAAEQEAEAEQQRPALRSRGSRSGSCKYKLLMAAHAWQSSWQPSNGETEMGAFTCALLNGMGYSQSAAAAGATYATYAADADCDSDLTLSELYRWVKNENYSSLTCAYPQNDPTPLFSYRSGCGAIVAAAVTAGQIVPAAAGQEIRVNVQALQDCDVTIQAILTLDFTFNSSFQPFDKLSPYAFAAYCETELPALTSGEDAVARLTVDTSGLSAQTCFLRLWARTPSGDTETLLLPFQVMTESSKPADASAFTLLASSPTLSLAQNDSGSRELRLRVRFDSDRTFAPPDHGMPSFPFVPASGCLLSCRITDEDGAVVARPLERKLAAYLFSEEDTTRSQQYYYGYEEFCWDGRADGAFLPGGWYTIIFTAEYFDSAGRRVAVKQASADVFLTSPGDQTLVNDTGSDLSGQLLLAAYEQQTLLKAWQERALLELPAGSSFAWSAKNLPDTCDTADRVCAFYLDDDGRPLLPLSFIVLR